MHKIYISFKIVKNGSYLDTVFDTRLSLLENFKALLNCYEFNIDIDALKVYDPYKKIMLNNTVPLNEYNLKSYRYFLLY